MRVGQFIKECLLLITKSLKIQNKSFFDVQKFFKSLAAFLESIVLLLEILNHKLLWDVAYLSPRFL